LKLSPPTIYRYIGGEWVRIAVGNENSTILCASATGDGAFYLGEPAKPKKDD
jgi:hypothetical protein